jgi:hypothetical protein
LVAVRDAALDSVWVFTRQLGDRTFTFQMDEDNSLYDEDGGAWHREGTVLTGPGGARLDAATFFDVMWFAWHAFFPETEVV